MKTVAIKTLPLISWKDTITFRTGIREDFDHIFIRWMHWKTDTTGLKTLCIRLNLDSNIGQIQQADGSTREYTYLFYLDPASDVSVYSENPFESIELPKMLNGFYQLSYEIYVDGASAYSGISVSNPVTMEIAFMKK